MRVQDATLERGKPPFQTCELAGLETSFGMLSSHIAFEAAVLMRSLRVSSPALPGKSHITTQTTTQMLCEFSVLMLRYAPAERIIYQLLDSDAATFWGKSYEDNYSTIHAGRMQRGDV